MLRNILVSLLQQQTNNLNYVLVTRVSSPTPFIKARHTCGSIPRVQSYRHVLTKEPKRITTSIDIRQDGGRVNAGTQNGSSAAVPEGQAHGGAGRRHGARPRVPLRRWVDAADGFKARLGSTAFLRRWCGAGGKGAASRPMDALAGAARGSRWRGGALA